MRTVTELVKVTLAQKSGPVAETITTTSEHPFFVQGKGFVPAGRLAVGNAIVTRAGPDLVVKSIQQENHPEGVHVYNLIVDDDHTYFVGEVNGGVWVHNAYAPDTLVKDILTEKKGSIKHAPLGEGAPSWEEIMDKTFGEIEEGARQNRPGYKTIRKLITDKRFNK